MQGEAPYHLQFRWVFGAPLPIGLDPKARVAMIQQRVREALERPIVLPEGEPLTLASIDGAPVPAGTSGGSAACRSTMLSERFTSSEPSPKPSDIKSERRHKSAATPRAVAIRAEELLGVIQAGSERACRMACTSRRRRLVT